MRGWVIQCRPASTFLIIATPRNRCDFLLYGVPVMHQRRQPGGQGRLKTLSRAHSLKLHLYLSEFPG
jgi:hypothetical protein